MSAFDVDDVARRMIDAVQDALGDGWSTAADLATREARVLADRLAEIANQLADGVISPQQAQVLVRMHKRSMQMVLASLQGIALATAQHATNSALGVVAGVVNGAVGFELLHVAAPEPGG